MSSEQIRNVDFGKNRAGATGSSGVGYTLLDATGSIVTTRTTGSVNQLASGSGMYQSLITFPDDFQGSIVWDTGTFFSDTCYATEEYNPELGEILEKVCDVSGSVELIRGMTEGRWLIDETTNKMYFYDKDNVTLLAEYDLKDKDGVATVDAVFERLRV
jgi:hypothetical protein